ncbi:MAG: hypothetical protein E7554_03100 [Ruminococcaceae bacterium]|nr:hypothetical protein [Oscillospiraceae bacterium]
MQNSNNQQGASSQSSNNQQSANSQKSNNQQSASSQSSNNQQGASFQSSNNQQSASFQSSNNQQSASSQSSNNQQSASSQSSNNQQGASFQSSNNQQGANSQKSNNQQSANSQSSNNQQGANSQKSNNQQSANSQSSNNQQGANSRNSYIHQEAEMHYSDNPISAAAPEPVSPRNDAPQDPFSQLNADARNPDEKKSGLAGFMASKWFIILQAVLLAVLIAVFAVVLLLGGDSCSDDESGKDSDSSVGESDGLSDDGKYSRFLSDKAAQIGYAEDFTITKEYSYFFDWDPPVVGIAGAHIEDLNSDGVKEMILVTAQEKKLSVSVYTIEDGQVSLVKNLFDDERFSVEENFAVFVKHHNGGSYIVLDYDVYPGGTSSSTGGNYYKIYELNDSGDMVCRMDYAFNRRPMGYMCYTNFTEVLFEYDGETDTFSGKYDDPEPVYEYIDKEKNKYGLAAGDYSEQSETDIVSVVRWDYTDDDLTEITFCFVDHTDAQNIESDDMNFESDSIETEAPGGSIEDSLPADFATQEAEFDFDTVMWLLEPNVKADDINVLRCDRPDIVNGIVDYNSVGKHKYDLISVYKRHGSFGLMSYAGGEVVGSEYDSITVGYDQQYALERYNDEGDYLTYTLSELHEQEKISDIIDITGTAENDIPVWCDSYGLLSRMTGKEIPVRSGINSLLAVRYLPDSAVKSKNGIYQIDLSKESGYVLVRNGERIGDRIYEDAGSFSCGIIPVKLNGKWGYVNEYGNLVLPFEYEACWTLLRKGNSEDRLAYNASDDYVVVGKGGQYALYNTEGRLIIDFGTFECIRPVYEGMCWVRSDGLWGVIAVEENAELDSCVEADVYFSGRQMTVRSGNGLRMRNGPETHYRVVSILSNRAQVTVIGETYDGVWSLVEHKGIYGWVKTEYLN